MKFVGPLRIHHLGKLPKYKSKISGAQKNKNATQSRPKFTREPVCSFQINSKFSAETHKPSYSGP